MTNRVTRRRFAIISSASIMGGVAFARSATAQTPTATTKPAAGGFDKGPSLDSELNRQVVGESHRNLERVTELVRADPELVNAVWDWGGGDFETPLGAAAHTGQREIAEFLLKNGARMDVFAAAMLGKLDVVKAAIAADPMVQFTLGPHGIPLWRHAGAGGDEAAAVLAYLKELEANDREPRDLPLSARAKRRYLGRFREDEEKGKGAAIHEFRESDDRLLWIGNESSAPLSYRGNHRFMPKGSMDGAVLTFAIRNSQGQSVVIEQGGKSTTANRIA